MLDPYRRLKSSDPFVGVPVKQSEDGGADAIGHPVELLPAIARRRRRTHVDGMTKSNRDASTSRAREH
jgi:hypothetical protein